MGPHFGRRLELQLTQVCLTRFGETVFTRQGFNFYCSCLRQVLQPLVVNASSVALIVTVVGPRLMPLAIIASKLPLMSFRRAQ